MTQAKKHSLLEAVLGTLIGLAVSILVQVIVFPLYGVHVNWSINLHFAFWFTLASIVRGYYVRRFFNYLHTKGIL